MRQQISDEEVQKRIDFMRKQAGSDDIHAMVRAYMQHHVDGFDHYKRVNELLGRMALVVFVLFIAFSASFCFSLWIAFSFEPIVVGTVSGICWCLFAILVFVSKS